MKKLLTNVSYAMLNPVIKSSGLVLVPEILADESMYIDLLSKTAGMFMVGGVVNGHQHWTGLDCFKGVLYFGNGIIRVLEGKDLESRDNAKAFFTDGGFAHVSEVYSLRRLPKEKKKRKAMQQLQRCDERDDVPMNHN